MKREAIIVVAILVLAGSLAYIWRTHVAAEKSTFRQAAIERVTYYRFKASFVVRDAQERIDFDYVAACAAVETSYKDGDRSMDTFGLNPQSFIKATRAGHAIQVVTPSACYGEATRGDIPPDLFPLAVFYEDVADMSFGWGYASQDAFDNPKARMSFEGAAITPASYSDWKTWRAAAQVGFKAIGAIRSPWGYSWEDHGAAGIALTCQGFTRVPVIETAKAAVKREWEARGKPEFWLYTDPQEKIPGGWDLWRPKIEGAFVTAPTPRTRGGGVGLIPSYWWEREKRARGEQYAPYAPNEIYPILPIALATTPPPTVTSPLLPRRLVVGPEWKGLLACGSPKGPISDLIKHYENDGRAPSRLSADYDARRFPFMVNDVNVLDNNGIGLPPGRIFERSEFILTFYSGFGFTN